MSRALPFTAASITRLIKGIEATGRFVVGAKPDGTLIIGDKPIDTSSLVPAEPQHSPAPERRLGDFYNGGKGETRGT